jgi:hypothetical protein
LLGAELVNKRFDPIRPRELPPMPFDERRPATFAWVHLQRMLVLEARAFRRNDGLDFCHAVAAAAYGSLATLDRQWRRRVEQLPVPNNVARIYYLSPRSR